MIIIIFTMFVMTEFLSTSMSRNDEQRITPVLIGDL